MSGVLDSAETALAEMRPWLQESLTVAIFETQRDINIVICKAGGEDSWGRLAQKPSSRKLDEYVWNDISKAFARPVNREDQDRYYLPTQILAEAFKAEGFDGIAYRSSLERGTNVVLFDRVVKQIGRGSVYTLKKVRYDFEADTNFYMTCRENDGNCKYITEIHTESP
jgi:hypothetical protein